MKKYSPELGQAVFGQPWNDYGCPDYVETALRSIHNVMAVNKTTGYKHNPTGTPFENSGLRYKNECFEANAYDWSDCTCGAWWEDNAKGCTCGWKPQEYNFKWGDLEVSWYKYLGRGMSINRKTTHKEIMKMMNECIKSLLT